MQVGCRLQRLRERRGMSQRALGELMGYSESWVQKVEAGQRGVERVGVLVQLADALRLPRRAVMDELFGDLLGEAPATFHAEQASRLVPSPPAVPEVAGWLRRRAGPAVAGDSVTDGGVAGELAAVFGEQHLSAPVVETLGRAGRELRRLDDQLGPEDLRGAVDQNLRIIGRLLRAAGPDRLHARLSGVAAEHAQLAGWLAFDSCDQQAARRHLRGALRAALAAADSDLAGYVLGWMGVVVMPSDARQGLDLAVQAQCQASSDAPPAVAAWLRRVEAEARARLGQERECMQALNEARRAVSRGRTRPNPPWMYFLDEAQLTAYAGLCYLRLRRPGQAKGLLERAVSDLATAFTRDRCLYLSYLADAHALANEPEQAVRFGRQSLSIATSTGSPRSIRRLYATASRLDPRAGPREVAQFREELITCLP